MTEPYTGMRHVDSYPYLTVNISVHDGQVSVAPVEVVVAVG